MLDIKFIRENPEKVQEASKNKGIELNLHHLIEIDEKYREALMQLQTFQEERNSNNKETKGKPTDEQIVKGKELKEKMETIEKVVAELKEELDGWLGKIPNPAKADVKVGKNESENDVIKTVGKPKEFSFQPKDHLALGEALDMIDVERAAKTSGTRFYYLKNDAVLLEFALKQFAFETLIREGFTPILPPVLIKKESMQALGYMENGGEEDMYHLEKDDLYLVGTAEQSIVPMHKNEVFESSELPKRYVGFSPSFRREAGSYGKDTRGIIRVHQFDKVEMVSYVKTNEDDQELAYLLSLEEKFLQALDLPYQVIKMCTGDLGFPAAKKYDIEVWMPTQNKYRELTSVSTTTDFQARRLAIKYREQGKTDFVNILNGTVFSSRPIAVILENYQQEDGSVIVPEVLRKYMGKDVIKSSTK